MITNKWTYRLNQPEGEILITEVYGCIYNAQILFLNGDTLITRCYTQRVEAHVAIMDMIKNYRLQKGLGIASSKLT